MAYPIKRLLGAASILALSAAHQAHAQVQEPASAQSVVEEVVVTGSRIVRDGYNAPTPTTVVGAELLEKKAPPTLIDALASLPALKNVSTPATVGATVSGNGGQSFVNLRGLGANRTLVLLDGQRVVPSTSIGTVDIAVIPAALLERVEVVTGGASAAWGSDAVTGVVNFVLNRSLQGGKIDVQAGVSDQGDAEYRKASVAYGTAFAGGRGHLLASGEIYDSDGARPQSRDYLKYPTEVFTNPTWTATNGQYRRQLLPYVYYSTATQGGLINAGPLRGLKFLPSGGVAPFTFGTVSGSNQAMQGPDADLSYTNSYSYVLAPQTRGSAFARLSYDLTPNLVARFDALYAQSETQGWSSPPNTVITGNYTIRNDNAFLPADVKTRMATANVTSFTFGRVSNDIGPSIIERKNTTQRYTAGLDGELGGSWSFHSYVQHGVNDADVAVKNNSIKNNFTQAIDAVISPTTGQPVCRSTLTNPSNGCVPLNLFGFGAPSAAAKAYVMGDSVADLTITQDVASLAFNGEPFSLPAGPVSVAVGAEYRREKAAQTVDAISAASGFALSNPKALNGKYSVGEAFGEVVAPIIKNAPLIRALDLNAAVRLTDYSTSGRVTTWKLGLNYQPIDDLRFRVTRSRDVRAPNLLELFSSLVQQTASVIDPVLNQTQNFQSATAGNPDLQPEVADTTAAGFVYQPAWFHGFSASIDYYKISIEQAISTISLQEVVDRCQSGNASLCDLITRDPSSRVITFITNPYLNLQSLKADGVDLDISYRQPLSVFAESLPGDISLRALGTYVGKIATNDGVTTIDRAGGLNTGQPRWQWTFTGSYKIGDFSTTAEVNYIGGGVYDTTYTSPLDFDHNDVDSVTYLNLAADYVFHSGDQEYQAYVAINNVADREPPIQFRNGGIYDRVGRSYRLGMRVKF